MKARIGEAVIALVIGLLWLLDAAMLPARAGGLAWRRIRAEWEDL